jgi:hypothetical protein
VTSQRKEKLRQRWLEVLRAELVRRTEEEEGSEPHEQAIAAIEDELRAMAERLAGAPEGSLLDDASIAQRLAVVTYLPHRLTATELEAETAALDAWFRDYASRNRA